MTTSDNLKIKGYVIPVRKEYITTLDIQRMSPQERVLKAKEEMDKWSAEIGTEEAIKVSL